MSLEANLKVVDLKKKYKDSAAVNGVSFTVHKGDIVSIIGPSGAGKSSLLRNIIQIDKPDSGEVLFDGKVINNTPPYKREVNTVFQRYALFPHLNVFENIAFGLNLKKVPKAEIKDRVHQMLKMVNLENMDKNFEPIKQLYLSQAFDTESDEEQMLTECKMIEF